MWSALDGVMCFIEDGTIGKFYDYERLGDWATNLRVTMSGIYHDWSRDPFGREGAEKDPLEGGRGHGG